MIDREKKIRYLLPVTNQEGEKKMPESKNHNSLEELIAYKFVHSGIRGYDYLFLTSDFFTCRNIVAVIVQLREEKISDYILEREEKLDKITNLMIEMYRNEFRRGFYEQIPEQVATRLNQEDMKHWSEPWNEDFIYTSDFMLTAHEFGVMYGQQNVSDILEILRNK